MSNYHLVIFDCDGVLVDSEPISSRVLAEELRALGVPLSNEEALRIFKGGKLSDAYTYAQKFISTPLPDNIEQNYRNKCKLAFEAFLQPIPGVKEMLDGLNILRCVASNGPRHKIASNLEITRLASHFNNKLYSAYDIQKWKPEPDLFLYAADEMATPVEKCVVIEDSVHGVEAARQAGMPVFGYAPEGDGEDLRRAGAIVFKNMSTLSQLLLG